MNELRAIIKSTDMDELMQRSAVKVAAKSMENNPLEKEIASQIKKEFDNLYGGSWQCVVGKSFGCYVTHETKSFIYLYLKDRAILLFKAA